MEEGCVNYIQMRLTHRLRNYVLKGTVLLHSNSLEDFYTTGSSQGQVLVDVEIHKIITNEFLLNINPEDYSYMKVNVNSSLYLKVDLSDEYIATAHTQLLLNIQPRITVQAVIQHGIENSFNQ